MEPAVLNKALRNPLALLMHLKVRVMGQINVMKMRFESGNPISTTEMRVWIKYLDDAWFKFLCQYDKLRKVSGRGRLFGLEACYSDLYKWYWGFNTGWQRILEEEQAKPKPDYVDKLALEAAIREQLDEAFYNDDDDDYCSTKGLHRSSFLTLYVLTFNLLTLGLHPLRNMRGREGLLRRLSRRGEDIMS